MIPVLFRLPYTNASAGEVLWLAFAGIQSCSRGMASMSSRDHRDRRPSTEGAGCNHGASTPRSLIGRALPTASSRRQHKKCQEGYAGSGSGWASPSITRMANRAL